MTAHRVVLTRLHGDGTETVVADEVPVSGLRVMTAVSGAGGVTGSITPEVARLRGGREAKIAALLAITGLSRLVESGTPPVPDADTLWLDATNTPHRAAMHLDGGSVSPAHTHVAESVVPISSDELEADGGTP